MSFPRHEQSFDPMSEGTQHDHLLPNAQVSPELEP